MFNGGIGRSAAHPRMTGLGVGSPWRHAPNSGTVSVVIPFRQWPQVNSRGSGRWWSRSFTRTAFNLDPRHLPDRPPLPGLGTSTRFDWVGHSWSSQRGLGSAEGRGRGLTVQQVVLPPHGRAVTQGFHVLQENTRIHSCRGHMHLRGASQSMEAIFPDGHSEILCKVNWNGEWHINYLFEDHVMPLLPKGTVLILTAWYDNTAANPVNPDPDQWVIFGRRSADEMSHMWIGATYLSDEDFEYLKAQRQQRLALLEQEQGGG